MKSVLLLAALARTAAAEPGLVLPEPTAPAPAVIHESTPSPVYYRLPDDVVELLVRTSIGVAVREESSAFAFDQLAGVAVGFGRAARTALIVETGYSYARFHDHLFLLGAGPEIRRIGPSVLGDVGAVGFALVPHAVAGSLDGAFGYGLRTSAIAHFALYGLEVAHQYMIVGDHHVQEVQLLFTMPMEIGEQ